MRSVADARLLPRFCESCLFTSILLDTQVTTFLCGILIGTPPGTHASFRVCLWMVGRIAEVKCNTCRRDIGVSPSASWLTFQMPN